MNLMVKRSWGFSLIEMIGLVAILAILATVIISTTPRRLDIAAANLENTNLVNYAAALQNNILRSRYIPGTNDWATAIAAELGVNVSSVTSNARNIPRYFLIDPAMQIGANALGVLPYAQSNVVAAIAAGTLTTEPSSPRVMLVTSLSTPLPNFITSGTASSNNFNSVWNWTDQSPTPPAVFPASWNNRGTDLIVQRINLRPLFVQLVLQNYPPPPKGPSVQGQCAIDQLGPYSVPLYSGANGYLLQNTVLDLYHDGVSGALQARQILNRDANFFYMEQVWRGSLIFATSTGGSATGASLMGSVFLATSQAFMSSPYYTKATGGMTPPQVVNTMSNFMVSYTQWAGSGFPSGSSQNDAKSKQTAMFTAMQSLVGYDGSGQLGALTAGACTNPPAY